MIVGMLIHCILIFGAYFRHRIAIIVWLICAIITCTINLVVVILGILDFQKAPIGLSSAYIVFSVYLFGVIIFEIWIIFVANNARKEIEASNQIPKSLF